jgi:hypothetical protein
MWRVGAYLDAEKQKVNGSWRQLDNDEETNITGAIKIRTFRWAGHVARFQVKRKT